jgi:hypothetical protein
LSRSKEKKQAQLSLVKGGDIRPELPPDLNKTGGGLRILIDLCKLLRNNTKVIFGE